MPIVALSRYHATRLSDERDARRPTAMPINCVIVLAKPPPDEQAAVVGEQADAERAEHAVDQVDAQRADRIVELDLVEEQHGEDDQHAGDQPDDDRAADA